MVLTIPLFFVTRFRLSPGKEGKSRTRRAKSQGYPEKGHKIRTGRLKKRDTPIGVSLVRDCIA